MHPESSARFWRVGAGYTEDALQLDIGVTPPFAIGSAPTAGRAYDFLVGPLGCLVVSSRIRDALARRAFTGYVTHPVVGAPADLSVLVVHGRCGPPDEQRSPIEERTPGGIRFRRGYFFDLESWTGDDLFRPEDLGAVFVVDRVREELLRLQPTNVNLHDLRSVRRPVPRRPHD